MLISSQHENIDVITQFRQVLSSLKHGQRLVVSVVDQNGELAKTPRNDFGISTTLKKGLEVETPPEYGPQDADTVMFFKHFLYLDAKMILEVGANEEDSANILVDKGCHVFGVDLRERVKGYKCKYHHVVADFVRLASVLKGDTFDAVYSLSALEHFGLPVYGFDGKSEFYDGQAMLSIRRLLKPGGYCYITVPYGKAHYENSDWRIYNKASLESRLVGGFEVDKKVFFKSGEAHGVPDVDGIVSEEDADNYACTSHPHITVFLRMVKRA